MGDNHHQDIIRSLFEAAARDDVDALNSLVRENSHDLVSNVPSLTDHRTTPLHVSALHGHLAFTNSLLSLYPGMAAAPDSFGRTPLHVASAEGHEQVVRALLDHAKPRAVGVGGGLDHDHRCDLCLAADKDGRIPLHWAVMRGRVGVITEVVSACPESLNVLLEGDTALHLAIKYNQLPALKELVRLVDKKNDYYDGLLTEGNREGNTILHLAVLLQQTKTVKYLLQLRKIRSTATETVNKEGFNAPEALEQSPIPDDLDTMKLKQLMKKEGVVSRWNVPLPTKSWFLIMLHYVKKFLNKLAKDQVKWISEARAQLIVVATIITTITFQVAVNPPGGVYQVSFTDLNNPETVKTLKAAQRCQRSNHYHKQCQIPGNAVLGYSNPVEFSVLTVFNTGAFLGSLCVSFILASGFPLLDPFVLTVFNLSVALTLESMIVTFLIAVDLTTPMLRRSALGVFELVESWLAFGVFNLILALNMIVLAWWLFKSPRYALFIDPIKNLIKKLLRRFPFKLSGTTSPTTTTSPRFPV